MDEKKIDMIIIKDEKELDRGHSLRKRGREKYDIEFNIIFFKEYLIKNNITVSIEDISKNERLQQYALELKDEDELDEADSFSEIEIEYIRKLLKYNKIEKELKEKWNKVHESFESKRSSKEKTEIAFAEIDQKLKDAKKDLIITIDYKKAFDKMVLKTLEFYLEHLTENPSDVDMKWLIFFMIMLVDLQNRKIIPCFNLSMLYKLELLSSNTLFELGPYLHKLLPTKQQFYDMVVNEDSSNKSQVKSLDQFPKIKKEYDRYMKSRGFMKKGLKTTSISKDIQAQIMRHYL